MLLRIISCVRSFVYAMWHGTLSREFSSAASVRAEKGVMQSSPG